jgi:hypothetical protein
LTVTRWQNISNTFLLETTNLIKLSLSIYDNSVINRCLVRNRQELITLREHLGSSPVSWTHGFIPCFVNTWVHPLFREHLGSSPVSWTPGFISCFVNTWVHPLFREHLGSSPVSWTPGFIPCFVVGFVVLIFSVFCVVFLWCFSSFCLVSNVASISWVVMLLFVLSCVQCCQYILGSQPV